jgi:UPF0755 protein
MSRQKQKGKAVQATKISSRPVYNHIGSTSRKIVIKFYEILRSVNSTVRAWSPRKKLLFLILSGMIVTLFLVNQLYKRYYGSLALKSYTLYIHKNDDFNHIVKELTINGCLSNPETFMRLARLKSYDKHIRPGAYKIEPGWSNEKLVNILRSGAQSPVMVTFNNIRTREELAGKLARQMLSDSLSFLSALNNDSVAQKLGFSTETFPAMFIPNSYSFYWTASPSSFLTRMKREYDLFWNETRKSKAKSLGLKMEEVATLASIIQEESNKNDEKPIIAGVYINRLRKNWPLQADPTIRFALKDFTIRRILTVQLSVDSPYNTYLKSGLPPGPINFPEISSLEAVLNSKPHDYYFFCAKEDFSGYHNFAKSLSEHLRNARKYQEALNRMKVFK